MVSTPKSDSNYYSKLGDLKHPVTKETLFNIVEPNKSCKKCIGTINEDICTHRIKKKRKNIASWLDPEREKILEEFYKNGKKSIALRELQLLFYYY